MPRLIIGAPLPYALIGWALLSLYVAFHWISGSTDGAAGQRELLRLYAMTDIGMTRADVYRTYCEKCTTYLLRMEGGDKRIVVYALPIRMTGRSWKLGVELEDDKVAGVRIRYHDTAHWQPKSAPPDKVAPQSAPVSDWTVSAVP